ncbi:HEAT repeat domain-containing protein [Streptomyces lomondensis]|uniref:HEAT repeat domain-containing protein n=1 Tax=Streptomyces lomondensis TaxID=68229 RepID=A0ABQ2X2S5_9ACTN|nr:HEAT repeat domain-containing protein [Streptomyces lomondensis]MCF0080146.1 HEAT repeat domain-containing protein [Streptomyces lomondensis]GGW95712.1 hypothetical protein GCM10010383_26710 [Streptomyces lomondensis]
MFTQRRARREREKQHVLSLRLRSSEAEIRAAAAAEIARVRDREWAVRELAQALDREPSPDAFSDLVPPFCDAVCRDRSTRERLEQVFAAHADAPAALVRAWTAFLAEYTGGVAVESVDDDLADEVRRRLRRLSAQGLSPGELPGMPAGSFAYDVTLSTAVDLLHGAVRRCRPLDADEAERVRKEIRGTLERCLKHPANSEERSELLVPLCERPDEESWADRSLAVLCVEEALALCRSGEPARVALGVEALHCMYVLNEVLCPAAVRETLDRLRVAERDPFTFSEALYCYAAVHADRPLDDPPVEFFLSAIGHPDPLVRAAAAAGLDTVGSGLPQETRAVAALIEALDQDPDAEVVWCAASALSCISCDDEANSRAASAALARHTAATDPRVRAAVVAGALRRAEPGAFEHLAAELRRPDVDHSFVSVAHTHPYGLSGSERAKLTRLLERLRQSGWAGLAADDDVPDAESRALMIDLALGALRTT